MTEVRRIPNWVRPLQRLTQHSVKLLRSPVSSQPFAIDLPGPPPRPDFAGSTSTNDPEGQTLFGVLPRWLQIMNRSLYHYQIMNLSL